MLPDHLYPERDANGDRRYSEELVEHIREWCIASDLRTGKGLALINAQRAAAA